MHRSRPIRWFAAAVLFVVSFQSELPTVLAQSESGEISVKEAYRAGMKHYQDGEYEEAIEQFRRVLDQKPHPVLYFNLSQAYIRLGEWEKAAKFAEKADEKEGLDATTTIRNRASESAARAVLLAGEIASRLEAEQQSSEPPKQVSGSPQPPVPSRDESALGPLGWAGIATGAAGLGLATWGVIVDANLKDDFQTWNDKCRERRPLTNDCEDLRAFIDREQTKGKIFLYGGAGLAAVGGGLLVADLLTGDDGGRASRAAPRIRAGRDRVTFGLSVSF